jgi:hypothetical protein
MGALKAYGYSGWQKLCKWEKGVRKCTVQFWTDGLGTGPRHGRQVEAAAYRAWLEARDPRCGRKKAAVAVVAKRARELRAIAAAKAAHTTCCVP